MDNNINIT